MVMKDVAASAPGKVLFAGAYAILLPGNTGYSVAVRNRARVWVGEDDSVGESAPPSITIGMLQSRAACRVDGKDWSATYGKEMGPREKDRLNYVKNAAILALRYLRASGEDIRGLHISTLNDPGFTQQLGTQKTRLGSSSAVTVATVGALFKYCEKGINNGKENNENRRIIANLSQLAHAITEKSMGSGYDVSTSVFGSQAYRRYSPVLIPEEDLDDEALVEAVEKQWDYYVEPLEFPKEIDVAFGFAESIAPPSKLIQAVRAFEKSHPHSHSAVMDALDKADKEFIGLLKGFEPSRATQLGKAFDKTWEITKELGHLSEAPIETREMSYAFDAARRVGAWGVKLQGAGGGHTAIALCPDHSTVAKVQGAWGTVFSPLYGVEISRDEAGLRAEDPKTGFRDVADSLGLMLFD